ncbi:hypothetical protein [Streptomyces ginkgonis]|uniref:hypothetical protein n=1 Tax=Streptomyces ginkgonis TaxID=1812259 RepID=UPI002176CE7F|nr:hypothetical protein [Streptomyces ginkgonis]
MSTQKKNTSRNAARRREAAEIGQHTSFEHRGIRFRVPHPLDMPVSLLEAADEIEAIRLIVGERQWEKYKSTGATIRDFKVFADKVAKAQGHDDAGN